MPLFSEHISNMYYSGTPSYTSAPYSYSSSPYGTSYSASYLNPGGNYSNHSSLVPYSRTLSSRWLGRNYSPMLSTISEKGTTSPVRINSPRRTPVTRTYTSHVSIPTGYTSRPININTADIDVSRDKYRSKVTSTQYVNTEYRRNSPVSHKDNEVSSQIGEKPNTGIDSSTRTQPQRSTIKRDRPVVRLHTVKRKDRDSPRQPTRSPSEKSEKNKNVTEENNNKPELLKWRERLADDLAYKNKKEKKTIGEKLVEKFTLKDYSDSEVEKSSTESIPYCKEASIEVPAPNLITIDTNKSPGRRCSMEHLAEEASLLDSMIRRENLSTATLDVSKTGNENNKTHEFTREIKRKMFDQSSPLTTTKSDHSVFSQQAIKRKSLRKSTSGENIRILDRISEIAQSVNNRKLITKEEKIPIKNKLSSQTTQKLKPKITSSVEVSSPPNPLKVVVENVTIEEKPLPKKKDIVYSSVIEDINEVDKPTKAPTNVFATSHRKSVKIKLKPKKQTSDVASPEPEDGNFWGKIGKRETVYLIQRKKELEKVSEQNKRSEFWFPEEEENDLRQICNNGLQKLRETNNEPVTDNTHYETPVLKSNTIEILPTDIKPSSSDKSLPGTSEVLNMNKSQEQAQIVNEEENMIELSSNITQETDLRVSIPTKETKTFNMKKSDDFGTQDLYSSPNDVSTQSVCKSEIIGSETPKLYKETSSVNKNKKVKVIQKVRKITENIHESNPHKKSSDKLKKENLEQLNICENNTLKLESQQGEETVSKDLEEINISKAINNDDSLCKIGKSESQLNSDSINNEIISSVSSDRRNHDGNEKSSSKFENNKWKDDQLPSVHKTESELNLNDDVSKLNLKVTEKNDEEIKAENNLSNESQNKVNEDIPNENIEKRLSLSIKTENEKESEAPLKKVNIEKPIQNAGINLLFTNRKPVKDVPAPRPLIATPRPLQKKAPRVIHSSSSSETSSSEESSEEEESSESSADFYECENNIDGRTSTGSNDSGFDSSAPTSPSGFSYVRKGADIPSTSSGSAPPQINNYDIVQHELEQSTAYGLFKKTGRFTPPARSIPRFRKYTIDDFQFIKVLGKGSFGKVSLN